MKHLFRYNIILLFLAGLFFLPSKKSLAQQLVYRPKNPAFGGSPLNYQWLLSSANTQNLYKRSRSYGYQQDPLADFQQSLQRQVLSELTRKLINDKFGDDFNFDEESTLKFGEFNIDVNPGVDGVNIKIFDILTGKQTNITIPNVDG